MRRDWPWPPEHLDYFGRKARRAMAGHERATELTRAALIWLALCGAGGRPIRNLQSWTRKVSLPQLAEFIRGFDIPWLREWVEKQVGFPPESRIVYAPRRPLPDGMRRR